MSPIRLRPAIASDVEFILNSWLKSYRHSFFALKVPNGVYFDHHKRIIVSALQSADSRCMIAHHEDESDIILGYIVYSPHVVSRVLVVDYMYVKAHYRRLGVGNALLRGALEAAGHFDSLPVVVTHVTSAFAKFCRRDYLYNPYLLMGASP